MDRFLIYVLLSVAIFCLYDLTDGMEMEMGRPSIALSPESYVSSKGRGRPFIEEMQSAFRPAFAEKPGGVAILRLSPLGTVRRPSPSCPCITPDCLLFQRQDRREGSTWRDEQYIPLVAKADVDQGRGGQSAGRSCMRNHSPGRSVPRTRLRARRCSRAASGEEVPLPW